MAGINEVKYRSKQNNDEMLITFISNINILRKNITIYPPGHTAIHHAVKTLSNIAQVVFAETPSITINMIKNNMLVNGKLVGIKNIHIQNFSMFFSSMGIASLIFTKGLSGTELEGLLQLTMKVQPKKYICQYKEVLDEINALENIRLKAIDLSTVQFIDETSTDSGQDKAQSSIWQKLMLGCLSPDLLETQDAALLKTIKIYEQGPIKTFLQDFNIPEERLLNSYRAVLQKYFHTASKQKDEFFDKQDFFKSIGKAFSELSPEIKEKFLMTSFDTLNGTIDEKSLEEMLHCMPGDMVVEVLTQAVLNKKMMSPMLIKLLSVLYRAGKQTQASKAEQNSASDPIWERIEKIFDVKGYEKYLSEDYIEQLQNISLESGGQQAGLPKGFSKAKHVKALQEQNVNRHLCTALLLVLEGNIDEEVFIGYVKKISQLIPELLEARDYRYLCTIYKALSKQMNKEISSDASDVLTRALNIYLEGSFTAKLAQDFDSKEFKQNQELEELIILTGSSNLPWLIDQYLLEKNKDNSHRIYNLICRFGDQAVEVALEKLTECDIDHTFALLKLVRDSSEKRSTAKIRPLLKSKHLEVRLEVIRTLLEFNDPEAVFSLQDLVRSKNNETAFKAMRVISDYKVSSLASELAVQIKTFYITEPRFTRNKAILALLGSLGNADVLPILSKKAGARISLTRIYLRRTQEYLYKTLSGYPRSSIDSFVTQGLRSKNDKIAATCEKLSNMPRGADISTD